MKIVQFHPTAYAKGACDGIGTNFEGNASVFWILIV